MDFRVVKLDVGVGDLLVLGVGRSSEVVCSCFVWKATASFVKSFRSYRDPPQT